MYLWHKRVPASCESVWNERVRSVVDPARIVVVTPVKCASIRMEIYCAAKKEGAALVHRFGGGVREIRDAEWHPAASVLHGRPLKIAGRLLITGHRDEVKRLSTEHPDRKVLCIPAAMAFGTGEHATTAMCLRFLLEVARQRVPDTWYLLDLGTGSGILALAAKQSGARGVLGIDNDPSAVRTARENARLNSLGGRELRFARSDLAAWSNAESPTWAVVTANLFSELLIHLMPGVIAPAVAQGGDLILSGVLATQADEVVEAVRAAGFLSVTTKRRGRWRAFHCRRD